MKCSICNESDATVCLKHVVNGVTKELSVCKSCAGKHGFEVQLPLPMLTDFLFGVGRPTEDVDAQDNVCRVCHMHRSDFHKASLLGCPACYEAFGDDIGLLLDSMHKGNRHFGKVPVLRRSSYVKALRAAIEQADRSERTTEAERLRAWLRRCEQGAPSASPRGRGGIARVEGARE